MIRLHGLFLAVAPGAETRRASLTPSMDARLASVFGPRLGWSLRDLGHAAHGHGSRCACKP